MFIFGKLLTVTLVSIRRSFVVYSAGRIQVGKRATFVDAMRAFRVLWKRVIGTRICFEVMDLARTMFLYSPTFFFNNYETGGSHLLYWLTFITILLSFTFYLCSEFAFQLVTYVPILDQACGWEAFGRGWRLLKGRRRVSVGIAACSLLVFAVVLISVSAIIGLVVVMNAISQGKLPKPIISIEESRELSFYASVIPAMALSVHVLLMDMIYAMFCMSCMAFHQESIVKSSFRKLTRTGRDHDC